MGKWLVGTSLIQFSSVTSPPEGSDQRRPDPTQEPVQDRVAPIAADRFGAIHADHDYLPLRDHGTGVPARPDRGVSPLRRRRPGALPVHTDPVGPPHDAVVAPQVEPLRVERGRHPVRGGKIDPGGIEQLLAGPTPPVQIEEPVPRQLAGRGVDPALVDPRGVVVENAVDNTVVGPGPVGEMV